MATRRDVAKMANVSPATVTNVYNQSKFVSPEIRKRVFDAAKQIGYGQDQSMEFVFLCDDVSNPHNIDIFKGMCDSAANNNAFVSMIAFSDNIEQICNRLINKRISGVFISNAYHSISENLCNHLENNGVVVSSSWKDYQVDFSAVPIMLVDFLVSLRHTKIGYLTNRNLMTYNFVSFKNALSKNHIEFDENLIIPGSIPFKADMQNGYSAIKNALLAKKTFTAVIAANDLMAIGAIRAIKEFGLSVPEDISVVSCDDISFAQYCTPSLTTVHLPTQSLGKTCLLNMILKKRGEETHVSHEDINIIVRESAAPPRKTKKRQA